jgi:hypothetical protein
MADAIAAKVLGYATVCSSEFALPVAKRLATADAILAKRLACVTDFRACDLT